jgi:predicted house-cleaning noncanonical NTP pyrophosphatase (MazG superfamily)
MDKPDLLKFLDKRMSMTDVYQPVLIKELLLHDGRRTKTELASALAAYDLSVQEYYERIVMRWPKITLSKHGIIDYERSGSIFHLLSYPESTEHRMDAVRICEEKISNWLERKKTKEHAPEAGASVRYTILKAANGKCALCGISSEIKPIDIDHIIPRSKADKNAKVRLHGKTIDVNDPENLQALCFSCNRAKRDKDETDFRRREKLVRDRIPELIRADRREPIIKELKNRALTSALYDKLTEEHAELLAAKDAAHKHEELADMIEVIFALGNQYGVSKDELMQLVERKRDERGGFKKGYLYRGDDQEKKQNTKNAGRA